MPNPKLRDAKNLHSELVDLISQAKTQAGVGKTKPRLASMKP